MEKYYVSGCKGQDDDIVTCDESEAEFWTLYQRMADGTSQGIIDLKFREDAEAAMAAYAERDTLQQKLDAVVAENSALKSAFNPEVIPEEAVKAFTETAIMDHDWNDTGEWSWVENDTDVIRAVLEAIKLETPATDAILNAVRAEGADKVADYHFIRIDALKEVSRQGHLFHKAAYSDAINVANLLRADRTKGGCDD